MKKVIFLFTIGLMAYSSYGQDPQLIDNDWNLHQLIKQGETFIPYGTDLNFFVDFYESDPDEFSLYYEGVGLNTVRINFSVDDPVFEVLNYISLADFYCVNKACIIFANKYHNFYFEENGIYTYEITSNSNGSKTLTITAPNGDQAIYNTNLLSNEVLPVATFKIAPNPTSDFLSLISENQTVKGLTIYSVTGNKVMEAPVMERSIDVSTLPSGLYFLEIRTENGRAVERFIKE